MGGHFYWYVVDYQPDIGAALEALRRREFAAGRYNPAMMFPPFPVNADSPAPGPKHQSIHDALEASDADGTRSILDLDHIAAKPDYGAVTPLPDATLMSLYGTTRPTREMVEPDCEFAGDLERGQGVYIVLYRGDTPSALLFAGYSFD